MRNSVHRIARATGAALLFMVVASPVAAQAEEQPAAKKPEGGIEAAIKANDGITDADLDFVKRERALDQSAIATVCDIFLELWNAPSDSVAKQGGALIQRAAKNDADMAAVNFAYGLLLVKHQQWAAAINAFEKSNKLQPSLPAPLLGIALIQTQLGKPEVALDSILKASQCSKMNDGAARLMAALITFFVERPTQKLKRDKIAEAEKAILKKLSPPLKAAYLDGVKAEKERLAALPELRTTMLQSVEPLRQQLKTMEDEFKKGQNEKLLLQQLIQDLSRQSVVRPGVFNQANNAGMMGGAIAVLQQRIAAASVRISEIELSLNTLNQQYRELESSVKAEEKKVDDQIALPPSARPLSQLSDYLAQNRIGLRAAAR